MRVCVSFAASVIERVCVVHEHQRFIVDRTRHTSLFRAWSVLISFSFFFYFHPFYNHNFIISSKAKRSFAWPRRKFSCLLFRCTYTYPYTSIFSFLAGSVPIHIRRVRSAFVHRPKNILFASVERADHVLIWSMMKWRPTIFTRCILSALDPVQRGSVERFATHSRMRTRYSRNGRV